MTDTPARRVGGLRRRLPWVVAGLLAVVVTLIAIALPHVHAVSARANAAADRPKTVSLPKDYQAAVQAAATEAANILSYSRKNFDADWERSLAGATGNLKKDHAADKDKTKEQLTNQKIDIVATVQHSAFESVDDSGHVLALVTVTGYAVNDQGERSAENPQRLELTMVKSGDKWLATDLQMIGIE